jgi:hypothetical protein
MSAEPIHVPKNGENKDRCDDFVTALFLNKRFSLRDTLPIAKGAEREVYQVEGAPSVLVKVRKDVGENANPKKKRTKWITRLKRKVLPAPSRQLQEIAYYSQLKLKDPTMQRHAPVANIFGFVDTDLGLGLVCEAIRQKNGQLGQTLEQLAKSSENLAPVLEALNRFVVEAYAWNIIVYDLNAKNLVLDTTETQRFVLVDGLGYRGYIPYKTYMHRVNIRSLDRRFAALKVPAEFQWDALKRHYTTRG